MSDDLEPRQGSSFVTRNSTLVSWLGFFLLVFAVAGFAFYFGGEPQSVSDAGKPVATTQSQ